MPALATAGLLLASGQGINELLRPAYGDTAVELRSPSSVIQLEISIPVDQCIVELRRKRGKNTISVYATELNDLIDKNCDKELGKVISASKREAVSRHSSAVSYGLSEHEARQLKLDVEYVAKDYDYVCRVSFSLKRRDVVVSALDLMTAAIDLCNFNAVDGANGI